MARLHERWSEYTDLEIAAIKKEKCMKCPYRGRISTMDTLIRKDGPIDPETGKKMRVTLRTSVCCDYLLKTGKMREGFADECEHYKDKVRFQKKLDFSKGIINEKFYGLIREDEES